MSKTGRQEKKTAAKKPYRKPALRSYGNIHQITQQDKGKGKSGT